jgi:hypothetical protein
VPHASERLASQVTTVVQQLRQRELYKVPAFRKRSTGRRPWPRSIERSLDAETAQDTIGVLLKAKEDIDAIRGGVLAELVART